MKIMKKNLLVLLLAVLIMASCDSGEKQEKIDIAVIGKIKNDYWSDAKAGAESSGEYLGVSVSFYAPDKEDPAWQMKKIEELTAKSVNGIAFAASDPKSIAPIRLKAMQAEIPCIALDTDVAKSRHAYIGTGNYHAGQQAGQKMVSLLDSKGRVAIITDSSDSSDSLQRMRGFRDIIAEYIDIEIVTTIEENNDTSKIEALINSDQDLNGIFCSCNPCGILAAEAVKKTNSSGRVKIVCIGESPDIMKLVLADEIQVAIARKPYRMGFLSVLVLHNMAKIGVSNALMILPKSEIIDTGIVIVTPRNILQYREQLKRLGIEVKF